MNSILNVYYQNALLEGNPDSVSVEDLENDAETIDAPITIEQLCHRMISMTESSGFDTYFQDRTKRTSQSIPDKKDIVWLRLFNTSLEINYRIDCTFDRKSQEDFWNKHRTSGLTYAYAPDFHKWADVGFYFKFVDDEHFVICCHTTLYDSDAFEIERQSKYLRKDFKDLEKDNYWTHAISDGKNIDFLFSLDLVDVMRLEKVFKVFLERIKSKSPYSIKDDFDNYKNNLSFNNLFSLDGIRN